MELPRFGFGPLGAPGTSRQPVMRLTGVVHPALDRLAELPGVGISRSALEQGQFLLQFLGLGFDVGEAGLAIFGLDAVIRGEGIGDEDAAELFSQECLRRLGRAMRLPEEGGQVVIAGIPDPVGVAVVAPGGFIGMSDRQGADLLEEIRVARLSWAGRAAVVVA